MLNVYNICDTIEGYELDVGNIDKIGDKCFCFIVLNFKELVISLQLLKCLIEMGFGPKCSILNGQMI